MTAFTWPVAVRSFPTLNVSTPRLALRPLVAEDAEPVSAVFGDRRARRWLPVPQEYGLADGHAWCTDLADRRREQGDGDHWAVMRRADDALVGCLWSRRTDWGCGCTEVSFAVDAAVRGFGIAPEALAALTVALLLEHDFQRVELRIAAGNAAARRVAEKSGYRYEGLLRNAGHLRSGRVDVESWSMVAADLGPS